MFYISPWMLWGLILCTVYFLLVLFGYDENRHENKARKNSEGKLVSSTQSTKDVTEGQQVEPTEGKPDEDRRREEFRHCISESQKQIDETTLLSCETSDGQKWSDGSKRAPAGSEESKIFVSEQSVEASNDEDVLQSQDALYLQELNVTEDFIVERYRIRTGSHESDNSTEIPCKNAERSDRSRSLEAVDAEVTEGITQTLSDTVSSQPADLRFDDNFEKWNEQPTELAVKESKLPTTDLNQPRVFEDFADILVATAQKKAFHDIDHESKANYLAEKISSEVVSDAISQFAAGFTNVDQEIESPVIQELQSFAGGVVDSLIQEASGNVSIIDDFESFAKDMSEQVINEGLENYAVMEKLRQGRKQKVSLNEMKIFSEGIVSEVVSDGIDEAVGHATNKDCTTAGENLSKRTDNLSPRVALSSSLQPHISGVVENLVNGALYEASLRVKAQSSEPKLDDSALEVCSQELLESQVNETVQELIVSALQQAADYKGRIEDHSSLENKSELKSHVESFVDDTLDAAVSEAAGKAVDVQSMADQGQKLLNGHADLSLESIVDQSQGVDEVPVKKNEGIADVKEDGSNDTNGYWRQNLILDLEGEEEEFDESLESEKSQPSPAGSPIIRMDKEMISDEGESEEFIDSSEDEVIDHAADAKLGAVGGSSAKKRRSDDEEGMNILDSDYELDDGIDADDDYGDEDDDDDYDDDDLLLTGQSMVDGLCVSKPKEKRKKKSKKAIKCLPRPRIQYDPERYVLSAKKNMDAGSLYNPAVVLDNGSGIIKIGLAGSKTPTVVQPALYGIPKRYSLQMAGMDNKKDRQYGDRATARAGVMQLEYPMSSGFLENWSDVEDIWENLLYNELGIEEGDHPILVTEVANTPKRNREKMAEILFEHLGVPAVYLANQLVLSLYASGLTVGMCLSSGFSVTQAAAIYEGHLLAYTVQELDIGGKALTDNLQKLLRENKGHNFNSSSGWQIVNNMKEKMAYVAQDYSSEMNQFKTSDALTKFYSLPDGQTVDISNEMISTPEPLFNPETLLGADDTIASQMPMHKLVNRAFKRCSPDIQDSIYRNIVLSGGTTLTRGLVPRLEHEIRKINPRIRSVRAPDNRMYSAWIGGSILGSLSTLDSMYATIDEYADYGGRIVNQKCF